MLRYPRDPLRSCSQTQHSSLIVASWAQYHRSFFQIRLEEEGACVTIVGVKPAGTKYTGKHGYPIKSDICVDDLKISEVNPT